jgi:uncharacterized protein
MKIKAWLVVLLLSMAGAAQAQVNALPQARHILVYGQAQARAIPDRFKIELTFSVVDAKADVAREKVETYLQDAIGKLKASSVPESEIVATSLEIEPRTEYDQDQRKQVFQGIGVTRKLSARFADQAMLKDFLSKLDTSEEVQVSGVTTELSSEPELRKQLRQKAIESTRDKAQVIAKGDWPSMYEWQQQGDAAASLDRIEVTGSRLSAPYAESFQTGYVNFDDKIYAVFLISE